MREQFRRAWAAESVGLCTEAVEIGYARIEEKMTAFSNRIITKVERIEPRFHGLG